MNGTSQYPIYTMRTRFPVSASALYDWHASPGALQRLTPPWEEVEVVEEGSAVTDGSITTFRMKIGPLKISWTARHCDIIPGRQFADVQTRGPFSSWRHEHLFIPETDTSGFLEDRIQYRFKLHFISRFVIGRYIQKKIERMFEYRHRVTLDDVIRRQGRRPLGIAVTGANGLIGRSLLPFLRTQGHRVTALSRGDGDASWDPRRGVIRYDFSGDDAVIHLAGEPIGEGAWTKNKMSAIIESRVTGTRLIAEKLAAMEKPPSTLISASAVGFYGDRGDALMTEEDGPGKDFISGVCRDWEAAARPAADRGIRVVFLRIGVALHPGGGALKRYLPAARLGLGGKMGRGDQYISWISMEDVIGAIEHLLFAGTIRGPVNLAAPEPVSSAGFARALGRALKRPALLTVPAPLIRLFFGRMGREVILSSTRVSSKKLVDSGYRFKHETLGDALHFLLGLYQP
ncbi:MAG TPA: TIGR01777 family oxidoreductase [Spirochaetota bacterium]|nr:TIGR01777 family oxidoreductase [Spirochaetota bacterium]